MKVEVPWVDGTTREVDQGAMIQINGTVFYADDGGYRVNRSDVGANRFKPHSWKFSEKANAVLVEGDPPPIVVISPPDDWTWAEVMFGQDAVVAQVAKRYNADGYKVRWHPSANATFNEPEVSGGRIIALHPDWK